MIRSFFSAVVVLLVSASLHAEKFRIDPVHSDISFKIRHLVVSKVQGRFDKFEGNFFYDEKDSKVWKASATIDTASINTFNPDRDKHLRSPDFFDTEKYPSLTFVSTKVTEAKKEKAKLHGNLTIRGVTKPVVLDVEVGGKIKGMRGETRAGFEATTKINRQDFGITWNKMLEGGGLVVGNDVDIVIHCEGVAE